MLVISFEVELHRTLILATKTGLNENIVSKRSEQLTPRSNI